MISSKLIRDTVIDLLREASNDLTKDFDDALRKAYEEEDTEVGKTQIKAIIDNFELARDKNAPMCQDTGVHVFYVKVGTDADVNLGIIDDAIMTGVEIATEENPLRPNAVNPITRENPGANVGEAMPHIHYDVMPGKDYIEINAFPKGAGSENQSIMEVLKPAEGVKGIKEFVLRNIAEKIGKTCPPGIIGVGIGGTADYAMILAKEALLRPVGSRNPDPTIAKLEDELLEDINKLGVGPMGLGGSITTLDVHIEYAYCHTASLPVGINIQCWAGRQSSARIYPDGGVEWLRRL